MKVLLRREKTDPRGKILQNPIFIKLREREREHALKYIFRSQDSDMSGEERQNRDEGVGTGGLVGVAVNVLFLDLGGTSMVLGYTVPKEVISPQLNLQIPSNLNRNFSLF